MTNPYFLVGTLVVGIAFIVVATTKLKIHPFIALLVTAYGIGLAGGLNPAKTMAAITGGFGKTTGYIGIVIACGCAIGTVLEKSGCALVMAETMLKLIGRTRAVLAMSCTGALVSIPVFCDSGYVVLSPLSRSLARQSGISIGAFAVALSMGLYSTHCLVPPTPGPVGAAGELGANLGAVILLGLVATIPVVATTYLYARYAGPRVVPPHAAPIHDADPQPGTVARYGAVAAFTPILLPVLLIAAKSVAELPSHPLGFGPITVALGLVGDPNTALLIGLFLAWFVVRRHGAQAFGAWCGDGLKDAGTIILITAAGGAFGAVLRETPLAKLVADGLAALNLGPLSIILPFIVAAGLKTSNGSSTVAMITTASMVSHLLPQMGLATGYGPALATLSIASGAMIVSHVNDSYFWVITQMTGLSVTQGYRLVTVGSAIAGVTGLAAVLVMRFVLVR